MCDSDFFLFRLLLQLFTFDVIEFGSFRFIAVHGLRCSFSFSMAYCCSSLNWVVDVDTTQEGQDLDTVVEAVGNVDFRYCCYKSSVVEVAAAGEVADVEKNSVGAAVGYDGTVGAVTGADYSNILRYLGYLSGQRVSLDGIETAF